MDRPVCIVQVYELCGSFCERYVSCVKSTLTNSLDCYDDNKRISTAAPSCGTQLQQTSAAVAGHTAQLCTSTVHHTVWQPLH